MKVLSLFSGIGGFEIACEWAGMEVVGQVEIDPFCQKVLAKHWPHVKRMGDIKQVRGDEFGTVDIIVGGVPCQPASVAGKRRGTEDDRWLWPEAIRIVRVVRPRWCVFENPAGILSLQGGVPFDDILSEMEREGYEVGAYSIPACSVGAPHKRERVFIVAYSQSRQSWQQETRNGRGGTCGRSKEMGHATEQGLQNGGSTQMGQPGEVKKSERPGGEGVLADTKKSGLSQSQGRGRGTERQPRSECYCIYAREQATERTAQRSLGGVPHGSTSRMDGTRWPAGPGEQYPWEPPRIAAGVKDRVARLKALGNAVVPQQVYPILKAIAEIEREATI